MTPPLTDAELDHRAEVARLDGNYLALELIRELRQAHTRVEAMAAVVAAAEVWRDEMERIALLAVDHESKNMSRRVAHDLLYEAITFNGPTGGAK